MRRFFDWLVRGRSPDLTIGPASNPQTSRWHLVKWPGFRREFHTGRDRTVLCTYQLALHKWHRSDDDRALHDHTAWNITLILWGRYREHFAGRTVMRWPLIPYMRHGTTPHRVELLDARPVWTLWLRGKPRRDWGFHCPKGWKHWADYCNTRDYSTPGSSSEIGKGCDE